ncbi:MAG: DEAD/DEAH box helicase family protein [Chloroflexales bacterium]
MPRPRKPPTTTVQKPLLDLSDALHTAIAVPNIRHEVRQWQTNGTPGITPTTKKLLTWWFKTDHRTPQGASFRFYPAQRDAIETLIYLFEVKQIRRRADLLLAYAKGKPLELPVHDEFARYALKMATGSGKTKVMALAMAWHYCNAVRGEGKAYATTFLLIAPNVIVLERLATDFAGGRIFRTDPLIPPAFKLDWEFDVYVRGEAEKTKSQGALYLTNIQQLYGQDPPTAPNPAASLLGPPPPPTLQSSERFLDRIVRRGNCMVLNDEAHHTNDKALGWNEVITGLHTRLASGGLSAQLDFSATPRQADGSLFTWTIYDYPLKQAILDRVVKRPLRGVAQGINEVPSDKASVRYEAYLVAAVERWKEYQTSLEKLKKRPILFLMLYDTNSADDVATWLRAKFPADFAANKLLVIHTDKGGEISKADLDAARKVAREVDEEASPVNCIVSVLMLREGWDVNNVTVVAGLRPFTAKAKILPEQAVGRGLRLMFRSITGYDEHVDIIGNDAFMQVVSDLEQEEGLKLDTFMYGKKKTALVIPAIEVIAERSASYDIAIPLLTPRVERKKTARQVIEALDLTKLKLTRPRKLHDTEPPKTFSYEGRDVITDAVVVQRTYTLPQAKTASAVLAFYAQLVAHSLKLPAQFAVLVPQIAYFLREKAYGKTVNLDSPAILQDLNQQAMLLLVESVFLSLLRPLLIEELTPILRGATLRLSATPPFPWSGNVADCTHTLFNLTPVGNEFEQAFAHFLDSVPELAAFANVGNLTPNLSIEYLDNEANLRQYEPDFVARTVDGAHWLLETKGREDYAVACKDARARQWCHDVSELTGTSWSYLKVPEKVFKQLKPTSFEELVHALEAGGALFVLE